MIIQKILKCSTLCTVLLTGCLSLNVKTPVENFSTLAPAQLSSVAATYTTTNRVNFLRAQSELVENYTNKGFLPGSIQPVISGNALEQRQQAISVLKNYTEGLHTLVNTKIPQVVASSTPISIPSTVAKAGTKTPVSAGDFNAAIAALNSLVTYMLQHRLQTELPGVVAKANPTVQQFSVLFIKDLDTLQSQTARDYATILLYQDMFIRENGKNMSPVERSEEIKKLLQIEKDGREADASFIAAKKNIIAFAAKHNELNISLGGK